MVSTNTDTVKRDLGNLKQSSAGPLRACLKHLERPPRAFVKPLRGFLGPIRGAAMGDREMGYGYKKLTGWFQGSSALPGRCPKKGKRHGNEEKKKFFKMRAFHIKISA